ncbi:MAG: replication factor C small subunit [Candidatus Aenigmarchaeota archaeon]|nr:replication factor C small subunit [Candidatus Aenigmarchaeota archaeon]
MFSEKYRPQKLNEVINQRHVIERMKAFVKKRDIPNLLFAGPAGTGKTSTALCMAKELYGGAWRQNVLELNASDERGIDVVRGKVKDFARAVAIAEVPFKTVILDESDALTTEAQHALRRTMEDYSRVTRFILIANYSSRIIEPIQSRCAAFRFKMLSEDDIKKFIEKIIDGEKLKITDDGINAMIYISEGDLRKVSNLLQTVVSTDEKITEDVVYDVASKARPTDVREMMELALKGKFQEARKILHDLILKQGLSGSDIVAELHRQMYSLDGLTEEKKVQLIEKCGECDFRLSQGGGDLIQLESLLAHFMLLSKK